MLITAKNLPVKEITAATLPGLNGQPEKHGFKVAGAWLNGSDKFSSAEECHQYLIGKEISPSKSGKSLVVVGDFTPVNEKVLKSILTARADIEITAVDLNDLI